MTELNAVLGEFRTAKRRLDGMLDGSCGVRQPTRLQAAELAADILVVGALLDQARTEAISAWRQEEFTTHTTLILQIPGSDVDISADRRQIALTKSFYSLRARVPGRPLRGSL